MRSDESVGGDGWAVKNGWVSVTPLGLRSDIQTRTDQVIMGDVCRVVIGSLVEPLHLLACRGLPLE